ncbi:hypothetical protein FHS85_005156 [Rhodoligotrophos appendicifer]|uniref:hypothetical protein n=1 Tax=Rhodoligotrophos appendicifer TaxID=987056 RepID=UPI00117FA99C|nr:hypothetical protein [Rhodoligotrophos appendicifer]
MTAKPRPIVPERATGAPIASKIVKNSNRGLTTGAVAVGTGIVSRAKPLLDQAQETWRGGAGGVRVAGDIQYRRALACPASWSAWGGGDGLRRPLVADAAEGRSRGTHAVILAFILSTLGRVLAW